MLNSLAGWRRWAGTSRSFRRKGELESKLLLSPVICLENDKVVAGAPARFLSSVSVAFLQQDEQDSNFFTGLFSYFAPSSTVCNGLRYWGRVSASVTSFPFFSRLNYFPFLQLTFVFLILPVSTPFELYILKPATVSREMLLNLTHHCFSYCVLLFGRSLTFVSNGLCSEVQQKDIKTPWFIYLPHLRALRVTQDEQAHQGRPGWLGFQVQWDQLDLQGHRGHRGHRTAVVLLLWVAVKRTVYIWLKVVSDIQIYTWLHLLLSPHRVSMVIMRGTMVYLESVAHLDHRYTITCTWEPWFPFYSRSSDSCSPVFCLPGSTWYCRTSCEYNRVCTALCLYANIPT